MMALPDWLIERESLSQQIINSISLPHVLLLVLYSQLLYSTQHSVSLSLVNRDICLAQTLLSESYRWKNEAMRDRHAPRSTWYHPMAFKKGGGGKANWGAPEDFFDDTDIPINEPFRDPNWSNRIEDNSKIKVRYMLDAAAILQVRLRSR